MKVLVFDIETIPDVATGKKLLGLENLSDKEVAEAMMSLTKEATGQTFVKHHLHQVVAISVAFRQGDTFKVWSLGEVEDNEAEIIKRFFNGIKNYIPTLVSWNGGGFDLPVLHYRSLYHGIPAPEYWETGESDPTFKFNNYLSRYHVRHVDLMDVLANYQPKSFARLDEIAQLLGFPGKMGVSGNQVWDYYCQGRVEEIRNYCETDVLNTYLIYLRFQLLKGMSKEQYLSEMELVKHYLQNSTAAHWQTFLTHWK